MTFLDVVTRLCWITAILSIGSIFFELWLNYYYGKEE